MKEARAEAKADGPGPGKIFLRNGNTDRLNPAPEMDQNSSMDQDLSNTGRSGQTGIQT